MKKNTYLFLSIIFMIFLINPINTKALEENIECIYDYQGIELKYQIKNNELILPFNDGKKINGKTFYSSAEFIELFKNSSKTSSDKKVCPTLAVEENDLLTTVFVNGKVDSNYNGTYETINAKNDNKLKIKSTKISNAIGIYNSQSYFFTTFRYLSDDSIEWSIDNNNFYSINDSIQLDNKSIISVDKNLAKKIFTNNKISDKIYRCISQERGKYMYKLSIDQTVCKNDLSYNDKQGEGSLSFNGSLGDPEGNCKATILGNPEDEESVAWLLKKLFTYLKILGPMIIIIMSGIDFSKAIINGDDETLQKCYKKLITRLVLAVVLFFIPTLVEVLLELFGLMGEPICILN